MWKPGNSVSKSMTVCSLLNTVDGHTDRSCAILYDERDLTKLKNREKSILKVIAMATASGMPDRQQRLLQLIECPICLNELQDPRLLSCRHIYCYMCLKDYLKKGNHENALPCPQCREVTTLYQGGVDNLPKFFFMNELKEVVMAEDGIREDTTQKHRGVVCSTEDCGQPGLKYCEQCEFLCQQCYDDHSKARVTKAHQVIPASEGEAFTKSKVPPYPPCHRHKHYVVDLYCRTCNMPVCVTCSQGDHRGHDCCDLDKQAEVCKTILEQICEDTEGLIGVVKKAIDKTKCQEKQAEADIDDISDNVKSTFKIMHEKLNKEENKMLSHLQNIRRRVKKIINATLDSQMLSLASMESLKSCQGKLTGKDSAYDYSTVTYSMQRDVEKQISKELPGVIWTIQKVVEHQSGKLRYEGKVDLVESVVTEKVEVIGTVASDKQVEVKEVSRIRLHAQDKGVVRGMVVHHQRVYVVHWIGLTVYCYTHDGSLSHKYEHKGGANSQSVGMCLMNDGDSAKLVLSNLTNKSLIWISIRDDATMDHHHTQKLDYQPYGPYNDRLTGDLMVCDPNGHEIHRYRPDGQTVSVINLPRDVSPRCITCHGDGEHYVVSDWINFQVVMIDGRGQVKTRYKGAIQSVKLSRCVVITDLLHIGVLIADSGPNQMLLLRRTGDVVKILDQHVISPRTLYLDTDHHRLYVSGEDQDKVHHVSIFNYTLLTGVKELTMKISKLELKVEI